MQYRSQFRRPTKINEDIYLMQNHAGPTYFFDQIHLHTPSIHYILILTISVFFFFFVYIHTEMLHLPFRILGSTIYTWVTWVYPTILDLFGYFGHLSLIFHNPNRTLGIFFTNYSKSRIILDNKLKGLEVYYFKKQIGLLDFKYGARRINIKKKSSWDLILWPIV